MLNTCPIKDYVAKNKWFQRTNKDIKHLQTTNDEDNSGNDDTSVASDAIVSVASASSGRGEGKKWMEWTKTLSYSIKK